MAEGEADGTKAGVGGGVGDLKDGIGVRGEDGWALGDRAAGRTVSPAALDAATSYLVVNDIH